MGRFETKKLPRVPDAIALDGSHVRILLKVNGGSMAHFELPPGETSRAVIHSSVEEIWYFLSGEGEMWRKQGDDEEIALLEPGLSITIPSGTHFQFRSFGNSPLSAVGVTLPPWPGQSEAVVVSGKWEPTVS